MSFTQTDITKENLNPFETIGNKWFLVSAGTKDSFNSMTASWGFMGVMWGKNCVITTIRPQRYTKEFIDKNEYFTFSFFSDEFKDALRFCGSHSGRDVDKMECTGLTPVDICGQVGFEQAEMVLVCKKLYVQEMKPQCFTDSSLIDKNYPQEDYHIAYYGEIVKAFVNNK